MLGKKDFEVKVIVHEYRFIIMQDQLLTRIKVMIHFLSAKATTGMT